jgi:hypothetical protein
MAFQFRRGTDAQRSTITPAEGEPLYATDTHALYVGDGTTMGGIQITGGGGGGGSTSTLVNGSYTAQLDTSGHFNANMFLALEGGSGIGGYSFQGDGGYDTGMFSNGDGELQWFGNSQEVFSTTPNYFQLHKYIDMNGQDITSLNQITFGDSTVQTTAYTTNTNQALYTTSSVNFAKVTTPGIVATYITATNVLSTNYYINDSTTFTPEYLVEGTTSSYIYTNTNIIITEFQTGSIGANTLGADLTSNIPNQEWHQGAGITWVKIDNSYNTALFGNYVLQVNGSAGGNVEYKHASRVPNNSEAWFSDIWFQNNNSSTGNDHTIFSLGDAIGHFGLHDTGSGWSVGYTADYAGSTHPTFLTRGNASIPYSDTSWHYIVWQYDPGIPTGIYLGLDGVLEFVTFGGDDTAPVWNTNSDYRDITIGGLGQVDTPPTGYMSNFRVQIGAPFSNGFTVPTDNSYLNPNYPGGSVPYFYGTLADISAQNISVATATVQTLIFSGDSTVQTTAYTTNTDQALYTTSSVTFSNLTVTNSISLGVSLDAEFIIGQEAAGVVSATTSSVLNTSGEADLTLIVNGNAWLLDRGGNLTLPNGGIITDSNDYNEGLVIRASTANNDPIYLETNSTNTWTFALDGSLTLPGNLTFPDLTVQTTAYTTATNGQTTIYARNALPAGIPGMIITISDSGSDTNSPSGNWAPAYWDNDAGLWTYIGNSNSVIAD